MNTAVEEGFAKGSTHISHERDENEIESSRVSARQDNHIVKFGSHERLLQMDDNCKHRDKSHVMKSERTMGIERGNGQFRLTVRDNAGFRWEEGTTRRIW